MKQTPKTLQALHLYFTKNEESSRIIFNSSIIFPSDHPNIWWLVFTLGLQATQSQVQLVKGENN